MDTTKLTSAAKSAITTFIAEDHHYRLILGAGPREVARLLRQEGLQAKALRSDPFVQFAHKAARDFVESETNRRNHEKLTAYFTSEEWPG